MGTQLFLTNSADKAQRKLDKPLREKVCEALNDILNSPLCKGERLSQPFTMVYSHHFKYKGKEYRIAYQYETDADVVYVLLIGPHENFYKKVKNLLYAS